MDGGFVLMVDVLFFDWAVLVATARFLAARRQAWCDYFVEIYLSALSCAVPHRGRGRGGAARFFMGPICLAEVVSHICCTSRPPLD